MLLTSSEFSIGLWSVISASFLYVWFRKRAFGFFDPMVFFLIMRVGPMLSVLLYTLLVVPFTNFSFLFFLSAITFLISLYATTPRINFNKVDCGKVATKFIFRSGLAILLLKIVVFATASGGIPIFLEGGSNAYIEFDSNNKGGSALLLGLGSSDVILFAFLLPLVKRRNDRLITFLLFVTSILLGFSGGKKGSLMAIFLAIALAEYLRLTFVRNQHRYFLEKGKVIIALLFAILWATWVYVKTDATPFDMPSWNVVFAAIDFVTSQFAYPHLLFVSGELNSFFIQYQVNRLAYFFHSILSPLGFPAFASSIGPALHEFQTGDLSGNGINPTFVIEGYVLFGAFMPIYAIVVGLVIGKGRAFMLNIEKFHYKIVLSSLLLPALYIVAIDALLFVKILDVIVILALFLSIIRIILKFKFLFKRHAKSS